MYCKPWERQTNESASAFYAFTIYRDQGHSRSLRRVADRLASEAEQGLENGNLPGGGPADGNFRMVVHPASKSIGDKGAGRGQKNATGRIENWSVQWGWVDRARAWDAELDRYVRQATRNSVQAMARRQAQEAHACVAANMAPIARFLRRQAIPEESARLDMVAIEDQMLVAIEASKNIPKLHEAERNAHCIRLRDMLREDGTVVTQWEYFERKPDREAPQLEGATEEAKDPL